MKKEEKPQQNRYLTLDGRPAGADGQPTDTDAQHHILNAGVVCPVAFGALDSLLTTDPFTSLFAMALGLKYSANEDIRYQKNLREFFGMAARNEILIDTRPDEITKVHRQFKDAVLAMRTKHRNFVLLDIAALPVTAAAFASLNPSASFPEALSPLLLGGTLFSGNAITDIKRWQHFNKLANDEWVLTKPAPPQTADEKEKLDAPAPLPAPAAAP